MARREISMIIIGITDIHSSVSSIQRMDRVLKNADLAVISGDLTHFGHQPDAHAVIQAIRKYNRDILAVPGNCDYPDVHDYLEGEGIGLHGRTAVLQNIAFTGLGGSLPCPGITPNEFSDTEMEKILSRSRAEIPSGIPGILISHQPPINTVNDQVWGGRHVGSVSVRSYIEKEQPLICFTGHIHEGTGTDVIGQTVIINPGPLRIGYYAYARLENDKVVTLEIRPVSQ
jgi:Icc-related predicted phosphoesterase